MRTSNPILRENIFKAELTSASGVMTIDGTVNKTGILLVLLVLSAGVVWSMGPSGMGLGIIGAIGGLIVSLITVFKKEISYITAPIYAVLEGLFIGGISAFFEAQYPGIVMQAVSLTFGTLFGLLLAYKTGLIRVSDNFKRGVIAATMGIGVVYLASFMLSLFHVPIPFMTGSGIFSIGFSLVVVVLAALNLVLDFSFIESAAKQGAPQYMEWFSGFSLMVTLVWLYIEVLRLLVKLRQRN